MSIVMTASEGCLLCGRCPDEGMHVSGQKKIKNSFLPYQLCRECCLTSSSITEDGITSRKKVWERVEAELMKNLKKKN